MKLLFKNNQKHLILLPIVVVSIILSFVYLKSNALTFQTNISWVSTSTGNWNRPETWGLYGGLQQLSNTSGIDVAPSGEIYLTDSYVNTRIVVLNPDGTASTSYQTSIPYGAGIKRSPNGYIYVVNDVGGNGTNYITNVFNSDGTASTSFSKAGINTFSSTGELYLPEGDHITILNPDGSASTTYGGVGSPLDSQIGTSTPGAMVVSPITGYLYYVDNAHNRMIVLDTNGVSVATYPLVVGVAASTYRIFSLPSGHIVFVVGTDRYYQVGNNGFHVFDVLDFNSNFSASTTNSYNLSYYHPQNPAISNAALSPTGDKIYITASISQTKIVALNTSNYTVSSYYTGLELPPSYIPTSGIDYPGINNPALINKGTVLFTQNETSPDVTISPTGILDLNGYILTIASGGTFVNNGGTLILHGGSIQYAGSFNVATSGPWNIPATWGIPGFGSIPDVDYPGANSSVSITNATVTLTQTENVKNVVLGVGGTLNLSGNVLNVGGNWTNSGGYMELNPGNEGTVNFNSNNTQTILGSNIFENLTKIVNQISGLVFEVNSTTTIKKNLTLNGASNGSLSITALGFSTPEFISVFSQGGDDVAYDSFGNIYVIDLSQKVRKYDSSGNFIFEIPTGGMNNMYNSVAVDPDDNLWVGKPGWPFFGVIPEVQKYDKDGNLLLHFGSSGSGDGQFGNFLYGIASDQSGNIYVSDPSGNHRVQKFDNDGNYLLKFGSYGTGNGQFSQPTNIVVDSLGYVYVVDQGNHRVQKFTSNGVYVSQFGTYGTGDGQFNSPWGIAIDPSGYVYVSDRTNKRVEIFNSDGVYKAQFGTSGTGNGQFYGGVMGLDIDTSGNVYVVDYFASRNQKFGHPNAPKFSLLHEVDSGGDVNLSGLYVAGSQNLSTTTFTCNSCLDGGSNINWTIIAPKHRGLFIITPIATSTATSTPTATSTATTTPIVIATSTSTTTPVVVPPVVIIKKGSKALIASTTQSSNTSFNIATSTAVSTTTISSSTIIKNENLETEAIGTTTNVILGVTNKIKTAVLTKDQIKTVDSIINSTVGSAVTQTISTTGVVAGASAALTAVTFANPISLAEIWLIPTRIFGLLVGALGIRRKNRPWGTIYDSVTKRPIDPAYVSLIDTQTSKEVATAITDLDGRYSFSVLPGTYKIVAKKTNYLPSTKMANATFDEVYGDLYHGDIITIQKEGEIITKNIPMDPQGFDWNEFTKNKMNINSFIRERDITWAKVSKIVFVLGFIFSLLGLIFAPKPYNLIITIFYAVAYALNYFVFKVKRAGTLVDKNTNTPLSFAIVKIFKEGETTPIIKKIADKFGNYYSLVPIGKYFVQIDKKNDDGGYSEVYQSAILNITNGVINLDVKV